MILLDTCTFIWLVDRLAGLSPAAREIIQKSEDIFLSAISAFEIALKIQKGKLSLKMPLGVNEWYKKALEHHSIQEIPVTGSLAILSTQISLTHKDPSDRIIAATAKEHNLILLTPDPLLTACREIRCKW